MKRKLLNLVLCFTLLSTCLFAETYSLFVKDGKYGLINQDRRIVMSAEYDWISVNDNSVIANKNHVTYIYNSSLKLLFQDSWLNYTFYSENEILIKASKDQLLNLETGVMTPFQRDDRYLIEFGYRDGTGLVWEKNSVGCLYSIVDRKGNVLLKDIDQATSFYNDGFIAVILKDGRSGFVNKKGKLVIETTFYIDPEDIGPRKEPVIGYAFNENYALVKNKDKKWIQFDKKGRSKELPISIEPVDPFYENGLVLIRDKRTKKFGYMNPKFEIVIPCQFDGARRFVGNYAVVVFRDKEAIIDKEGNVCLSKDLKSMSYNFF